MPTISDALAGARYQAPAQKLKQSVLLAGAASRLGERILARLLGSSEYQRIHVLASDALDRMPARGRSVAQRFWSVLVNTAAGLMVGAKHAPMSLDHTARAIVQAMYASQPGLTIIEMDHLHQILKA